MAWACTSVKSKRAMSDHVDGLEEAFEDVCALQGLVKLEFRAPDDDLVAEVDEVCEHFLEAQRTGTALDQGDVVDGETALQRGILEEGVEHHVGIHAHLEADDDADALAGSLVVDVGDAVDALVFHHLGDLLDHLLLVDHVGDLGHDDGLAALVVHLDLRAGTDHDAAAAGLIGVLDALAAHDDAAGREVGTLDVLHELVGRDVGVVDIGADRVAGLAEVVRGHVRRHTDGDAGGAVQQQERELGREDGGLELGVVEVVDHVDGILVDVAEDLVGNLLELGLRISHGRDGVAVHGAEVALAVDHRVALVPGLCQTRKGVIYAGVAVGVVFSQHLTDDLGAFAGRCGKAQAEAVHAEEHAALHGFEAVAHVREGAGDDDGHRIVDVGRPHLAVNLHLLDGAFRLLGNLGILLDFVVVIFHFLIAVMAVSTASYKRTNIKNLLGISKQIST